MRARRWVRLLWGLTAAVVVLLLLKFFVADVYRVDSGSMRPTLFGGRDRADSEEDTERVLVLYSRGFEPARFDLVVVRSRDGGKPLVKRVCGLPHDQDFVIRGGDLFVDHQRLPSDAPRPPPIPIYDDRWLDPTAFFEHRNDGSVTRQGDAWVVEGGTQSPGSLLLYHPALRDDYLDRHHRRVPGVIEVNDAVLELEFQLDEPLTTQKLRFQLVEEGDTFEVVLGVDPSAGPSARLVRRNPRTLRERREQEGDPPPARELSLARGPVALAAGRWYDLAFSNIDNHLRVRSRALGLDLAQDYDENEPWPGKLPPGQSSLGPRVKFGVEAGRARFRAVRILRDLYYVDEGDYGVQGRPGDARPGREPAPISLGPDEYFLLGDNSAASTDSRYFGPFKAAELIGRPLAVVWPEPRWLRPVAAP